MSLRDLEAESIRAFVQAHADKLTGRILDLGCGLQPYRDVVEAAGGSYHGWDRVANPGSVVSEDVGDFYPFGGASGVRWHAVLTTQTIQYVKHPGYWLDEIATLLGIDDGGWLVITGPTCWPVIETADKWRFTKRGIEVLLQDAGFVQIEVTERAHVEFEGECWSLGFGAVARA